MTDGRVDTAAFAVCWLAAWGATAGMRRIALRRQMLDIPNARSSHVRPTPRGGGVAIVIVSLIGFSLWALMAGTPDAHRLWWAVVPPAAAVAGVGFRDDLRPVPVIPRLLTHLGAGCWLVVGLGGLPALPVGQVAVDLGWAGHLLAVVAVAWILNLYNFMDGIDGIAGSQAVFLALGSAALGGHAFPAYLPLLVLAGACAGFLMLNLPPARIFMGDAGSGFLGFTLAALLLARHGSAPGSVWVGLILLGVFLVDATVTLARRLARGESPKQAHRSHAYQRLARRWGGHRPVTLGVIAINLIWLWPMACLAWHQPDWALPVCALALAPLVVVCLWAGAGLPDNA